MHPILEQIQGTGNDKLEYNNEKASQLTLLLEKARTYYADTEVSALYVSVNVLGNLTFRLSLHLNS